MFKHLSEYDWKDLSFKMQEFLDELTDTVLASSILKILPIHNFSSNEVSISFPRIWSIKKNVTSKH